VGVYPYTYFADLLPKIQRGNPTCKFEIFQDNSISNSVAIFTIYHSNHRKFEIPVFREKISRLISQSSFHIFRRTIPALSSEHCKINCSIIILCDGLRNDNILFD